MSQTCEQHKFYKNRYTIVHTCNHILVAPPPLFGRDVHKLILHQRKIVVPLNGEVSRLGHLYSSPSVDSQSHGASKHVYFGVPQYESSSISEEIDLFIAGGEDDDTGLITHEAFRDTNWIGVRFVDDQVGANNGNDKSMAGGSRKQLVDSGEGGFPELLQCASILPVVRRKPLVGSHEN